MRSGSAREATTCDARGIAGGDGDGELFVANTLGVRRLVAQRVHGRGVGRGEHVGRHALPDLRGEVLAAGERERDLDARVCLLEVRADAA